MGKVIDSIPVVSQAKSAIQALSGDPEGARETQLNFLRRAPVVSQATSLVQAISGDVEGAKRTQEEFLDAQIANIKVALSPITAAVGTVKYSRRPISTSLMPRPRWMGSVGVQALCLNEILIPGTHDSATYRFQTYKPVVNLFAKAQGLDIGQQLEGGIRYLDIRVNRDGDRLYCSHTYLTVPFDDVLDAVKRFVEQNQTEKVILCLDWDTRDRQDLVDAMAQADRVLGEYYVKPASLAFPLAFWGARQAVLVLERGSFAGHYILANSWDEGTNAPLPEDAVGKCVDWAKRKVRAPFRLNLAACQATPSGSRETISDLIINPEIGLEDMAARANHQIGAKLLADKDAVRGINIINMDFADDGLIEQIIKLNPSNLTEAGYAVVDENASRHLEGSYFVAYGANDRFAYTAIAGVSGMVSFSNDTFGGDPNPGVAKKGYFKALVVPRQDGWRLCSKCNALFLAGSSKDETGGKCHDGNAHTGAGSLHYVLAHDTFLPKSESFLFMCTACKSLHHAGGGLCFAQPGAKHVAAGSLYVLQRDIPVDANSQSGWRCCRKCYVLCYIGSGQKGICAAGGSHDIPGEGYDFVLSR